MKFTRNFNYYLITQFFQRKFCFHPQLLSTKFGESIHPALFSGLVSCSYRGQMMLSFGKCSLEEPQDIKRSFNHTNSTSYPHQTVAEVLLFIPHGYTVYQHGRIENSHDRRFGRQWNTFSTVYCKVNSILKALGRRKILFN